MVHFNHDIACSVRDLSRLEDKLLQVHKAIDIMRNHTKSLRRQLVISFDIHVYEIIASNASVKTYLLLTLTLTVVQNRGINRVYALSIIIL